MPAACATATLPGAGRHHRACGGDLDETPAARAPWGGSAERLHGFHVLISTSRLVSGAGEDGLTAVEPGKLPPPLARWLLVATMNSADSDTAVPLGQVHDAGTEGFC